MSEVDPLAIDHDATKGSSRAARQSLVLAWFYVFAANLLVPLLLSAFTTTGEWRIGMVVAILTGFAAGTAVCLCCESLGSHLILGGGLLALTQVVPIVQIAACCIAFQTWLVLSARDLEIQNSRPMSQFVGPESALGGFVVTILAAMMLMGLAVAFGSGVRRLFASFR